MAHLCEALEHARQGDMAKHREKVDAALKADPTNVDALIALYKLEDRRDEARQRIAREVKRTLEQIDSEPADSGNYNQLAWLIANTEGDLDKAIWASKKSIEIIRPGNPASYLDTLAHCYFAKRDYESAVKYQTEAAEHSPHTQSIGRALKRFQAALDAERSQKK
jgi:tetratricopeptide (TPR) repeat protein